MARDRKQKTDTGKANCKLHVVQFAISLPASVFLLGSAAIPKKDLPPMQEQQNIDLVRKLYDAFSKSDIQTIVDHLADQIDLAI